MSEPLDLKAIEARLESPGMWGSAEVGALLAALRETRVALAEVVTAKLITHPSVATPDNQRIAERAGRALLLARDE